MNKKILVALDNSDYATKVMQQAIELAKSYKTQIQTISVIEVIPAYGLESSLTAKGSLDIYSESLKTVLDKCMKLAAENEVDCSIELLNGNPAEEIVKYAEEKGMDIIVMGHLGETTSPSFLIGSVAQKVVAFSKCSVFIVR